jgi:hypothetical protein
MYHVFFIGNMEPTKIGQFDIYNIDSDNIDIGDNIDSNYGND